jgi:hypothetical protein
VATKVSDFKPHVILNLFIKFPFRWFKLKTNPHTNQEDWIYEGGYWDRNYEQDLDLF